MIDRRRFSVLLTRRFLLALAVTPAALPASRAGARSTSAVRQSIARVWRNEGLVPPLTLGMARVILRPGGWAATETPGGVRLLVVESGELVVSTAPQEEPLAAPERRAVPAASPDFANDFVVSAGSPLALGSSRVTGIRNRGSRTAVVLDAVVFHGESRPLDRAFTTDEGVSFQLLASAPATTASDGRVIITLDRVHLGAGGSLPSDLGSGLALAYVEEGQIEVTARAGEVSTARAAAAAPYSSPGAMRPLLPRERRVVSAGGAAFVPLGAEAAAQNTLSRAAVLLLLAVRSAR